MRWFHTHLAAKLLLIMFMIAVVPFAGLLFYNHLSEERQYTTRLLNERHDQMNAIAETVRRHFMQLNRELHFLAGSVVMEDLLINDLDQRVALLLDRYRSIYDLHVDLIALDNEGRVVASTRTTGIGKLYRYCQVVDVASGSAMTVMTVPKIFLLQVPVYSGVLPERRIGRLVMEYRIKNLERFNQSTPDTATVLFTRDGTQVGTLPVHGRMAVAGEGTYFTDDAIWMIRGFEPWLPGWYLGYRYDKKAQLSAIEKLNRFAVGMLLFGMIVIAVAAYWFSKRIVAPLEVLQNRASEMVRTRRYDRVVTVDSSDEIGRLAAAFNVLAEDIRDAFDALHHENIFRMTRLTQMIGLFHRLMQIEEESACLKAALEELKAIAPEYNLRFSRTPTDDSAPALYVYDFEHKTQKYYGSLLLPKNLGREEEAFFKAIASMIAARIDQIRAYRRLHRDAEAKTAFISHMSHDLRTPLHAILSQTQFLVGYGRLEMTEMERVGGIENAAQQLLGMINDLLDLARLEAGRYEPEMETLTVAEVTTVVEEAATLLEPLADKKAIFLKVSAEAVPLKVVVDRRFLRRIVLNLLSNAIKFTETGGISCRVRQSEGRLCVLVEDSGRGMTSYMLQRAFEPFVQSLEEDRSRGSGLGLALSRRFAQLFGAELTLMSDGPDRGSRARLCFTTI